jgi:repressor LexA
MTAITERQRELLTYLYEHARDRGYQPSYGDLCRVLGVRHKNGVRELLLALQKKGYLELGGNAARAVRLRRRPDGSPFDGFTEKEVTSVPASGPAAA